MSTYERQYGADLQHELTIATLNATIDALPHQSAGFEELVLDGNDQQRKAAAAHALFADKYVNYETISRPYYVIGRAFDSGLQGARCLLLAKPRLGVQGRAGDEITAPNRQVFVMDLTRSLQERFRHRKAIKQISQIATSKGLASAHQFHDSPTTMAHIERPVDEKRLSPKLAADFNVVDTLRVISNDFGLVY